MVDGDGGLVEEVWALDDVPPTVRMPQRCPGTQLFFDPVLVQPAKLRPAKFGPRFHVPRPRRIPSLTEFARVA